MSERIINKNFALSADFNSYIAENPEIVSDLPKNACVIFETKSDSGLNKENRKLAKELVRAGEKCFKAIKEGKKWRLEKAFS